MSNNKHEPPDRSATTVYLVRHGVTDWNLDKRFQGQLDIPLSEEGWSQARAVARWLESRKAPFSALYSSDLSRAAQTAEAIGERLQLVPVLVTAFREINCGEWQGLSVGEVEQHYPGQLAEWREHVATFTLPGGESVPQVQARVFAAFREVVSRHAGESIIIVSHGAALSALQIAVFGWDLVTTWKASRTRLGNTGVTVLEADPTTGMGHPILGNSHEHLANPTGLRSIMDQSA